MEVLSSIGTIKGQEAFIGRTSSGSTSHFPNAYCVVNARGEEIYTPSPYPAGRGIGMSDAAYAEAFLSRCASREFMDDFEPCPDVTRYSGMFQRQRAFSYPASWGIGLLTNASSAAYLLFPRVERAFHLRLKQDGPDCWVECDEVAYAQAADGVDLAALAASDQYRFGGVGSDGAALDK